MKFYMGIVFMWMSVLSAFSESVPAWEGLQTRTLTAEDREDLPLPAGAGLWVMSVPNAGPVAEGLRTGDVLFRFGEQLLVHPDQVPLLLGLADEEGEVDVVYYRNGEETRRRFPVMRVPEPATASEVIEPARGIPLDRARRRSSQDPIAEREAKALERIRQQVDSALNFGGSLSSPPLRRSERADDE